MAHGLVGHSETGPAALAAILALHGIAADPKQLRHSLGHDEPLEVDDIVRLAKQQDGVRCKARIVEPSKLSRLPLPALAHGPGGWFLIGSVTAGGATILKPGQRVEAVSSDQLADIWFGTLVLITRRDAFPLAGRGFDIGSFIPQIVRYRRLFGEVLLITLALNLLGLAAPLFFQNIIDKVVVHNSRATLEVLVFGFVMASVWEVSLGWLRTRLYSETSQKIDVELGARLFRHLMRLPIGYFESRRTGDTVTRVRQLESIREFLTNASLSVLVDPAFTVVFLIVMWFYSPHLFLIVAFTIPAYVIVSLLATGPLRRGLADKFERGSANNAFLVESVSAIQTIKSAAAEPLCQERWERQLAGYSAATQRVINMGNSSSQAIQLIAKLSLAALLFFGAREVIAGTLTVGALVAFNMLAQRVSQPVIRMAQLWQDFQQVRLSVERLGDILNVPTEPTAISQSAPPSLKGHIRFERVCFRYTQGGNYAVEDISFDLAQGQTLGIAGSSGSGKSTIVKLVQRLYLPEAGRVLVDGIDVAQIDPAWLRRQIGVVLQENLLFNRSIRENIALTHPAAPLEPVIHAAKLAGAHDFIMQLPFGYDTLVEERGVNLSGGQRQRIAIARALASQPRILIFDEATSALDAESEEIIRNNLQAIAHGRTVLIIAHRLSAIRDCDRIMTIEKGRIVESGTHVELLRAGGRYADLHRRQMGLREQAA